MPVGYAEYQWSCEEPVITSRYDQLVVESYFPHKIFYVKLLTPKGGGIFTLVSTTNITYQVS